jgi:hypothetical protein
MTNRHEAEYGSWKQRCHSSERVAAEKRSWVFWTIVVSALWGCGTGRNLEPETVWRNVAWSRLEELSATVSDEGLPVLAHQEGRSLRVIRCVDAGCRDAIVSQPLSLCSEDSSGLVQPGTGSVAWVVALCHGESSLTVTRCEGTVCSPSQTTTLPPPGVDRLLGVTVTDTESLAVIGSRRGGDLDPQAPQSSVLYAVDLKKNELRELSPTLPGAVLAASILAPRAGVLLTGDQGTDLVVLGQAVGAAPAVQRRLRERTKEDLLFASLTFAQRENPVAVASWFRGDLGEGRQEIWTCMDPLCEVVTSTTIGKGWGRVRVAAMESGSIVFSVRDERGRVVLGVCRDVSCKRYDSRPLMEGSPVALLNVAGGVLAVVVAPPSSRSVAVIVCKDIACDETSVSRLDLGSAEGNAPKR